MDNRDGVALVSSGDNEGVSVLSRAEKAAASSLEDENTLMYKARLRAYHNLPSLTQGKLDDLANLKGYNGGFIGMATTFWEQKIYPYFAKAFYGPQAGFEALLQRVRDWFKGDAARDQNADNIDALLYATGAGVTAKDVDFAKEVFAALESANLSPEETLAAVSAFCSDV
jgi:hypothetical protein